MSQDKHRATDAGPGAAVETTAVHAADGAGKGGAAERPPTAAEKTSPAKADNKGGASPNAKAGMNSAAKGAPDAGKPPPGVAPARIPARPRRGTTAVAVLSLLLTLGVIGAGAYFWQLYGQRQQQLDQRIAAAQQRADRANQGAGEVSGKVSDLQGKVTALSDTVQSTAAQLGAKVDSAVSGMQAKDRTLQEAVQNVHDELQRSGDDWIAAEAEFLIRVANQRLQLAGDTGAAVRALEDADRRLHDMGDPSLLDVRKKIADDIVALRAVPQPDLTGMSLTLTGLSDHVAGLPVAGTQPMPAALTAAGDGAPRTGTAAGGWRRYLDRLWAGLRQLVVIRHPGETGKPMLTPDERVILRQNLRLQLEAARVALLRGDGTVFRDTLAGADKWLDQYFDTGAQPVISMRQAIKDLQGTDLTPQLPDLSGDLKALRAWEEKHAGKATATGDAGAPGKAAS